MGSGRSTALFSAGEKNGMTPGRILIVEDDLSIQEFMTMALEDEGYQVTSASNGAIALDILKSFEPHLVLVDMLMPVMDGRAFIEACNKLPNTHLHIIALSASRNLQGVMKMPGVDGFLAKPFNLDELLDSVNRYMPQ
jgi:CheY-like chemotaxis protein